MSDDSVAQLVEQLTLNQWVVGSSPTGVTELNAKWLIRKPFGFFCYFNHWLSPCGANANFTNYVNDVTGTPATSQVILTQVLHLSHASEGVPREKLTVIFLNS